MPALVAGIHVFLADFHLKAWMAGTSPAMTPNRWFYVLRLTATTFSLVILACAVFAAAGGTHPPPARRFLRSLLPAIRTFCRSRRCAGRRRHAGGDRGQEGRGRSRLRP